MIKIETERLIIYPASQQDGIWNMPERNRELTQRLGIGGEEE